MKTFTLSILIIGLFTSLELIAQKKKDLSYYQLQTLEKGDTYFQSEDYYNAITTYKKVLRKVKADTSIIFKIAECYKMLNSFGESEEWYSRILNNGFLPSIDPVHILNFAQVLTVNGKYDEALYWYKEYYFSNTSDPRGLAGIKTIENINQLYYDTTFYMAIPVNINTAYTEFSPIHYNDGVIFISDRPRARISESNKGNKPEFMEWFFTTPEDYGIFTKPERFTIDDKTSYNKGPLIFYDDYKKMIFTKNADIKIKETNQNTINVHLYSAEYDGKNWNRVKPLDFCENQYSYAQPAINSDGTVLIFSSNMPSGFGGSDLYISYYKNGSWQEPENLGKKINGLGNEMFPYIYKDSLLYFSSDGHGGLGGLDICYIPLVDTGEVSNLGVPVNSPGDDFAITFDEDGMSGYFSSNRENSKGRDDIYAFRIIRISLTLKIIDINTSNPISNAEVFSISGMDESFIGKTDEDGYCTVIIPVSKEIKVRVKKEDFDSQVFTFEPMKYHTENLVVLPLDGSKEEELDVVYKVQVLATRKQATTREIKRKYKGKMPVAVSYEDDWYKYTIGEFTSYDEACQCLSSCNVHDAFIVAYINNKRATKARIYETDTCTSISF